MKSELLIELLCEEIPAGMQANAREDFARLFTQQLNAAGLQYTSIKTYSTPRRLTLVVEDLQTIQEDILEERRGPRVGAPDQAVQGFLASVGLKDISQCEIRATDKGEFYFANIHKKGQNTAVLLPKILEKVIDTFVWPKSMRWAHNSKTWIRPLRSILCVFGGKVVPGEISLGTNILEFQNSTVGHRFHAPNPFQVSDWSDYKQKLNIAKVIIDHEERKAAIQRDAEKIATEFGATLREDIGLLEEVTGLVEWPVILHGEIDHNFMDLPVEVLITSMRVNQRYFTAEKDGKLVPYFIFASNIEATDGGNAIVIGNQRVLSARLSDAKFFYEQDKMHSLAVHANGLATTVFHADLGSMADKVERLESLCDLLAEKLSADRNNAKRAAKLSKADLMTNMVGEFPGLQGIMGRYYAINGNENSEVAEAISDQYRPKGPTDPIPEAIISKILAMADKIDTLVGFFAANIRPTGSGDPFALRRAALGIIRISETFEDLALVEVFEKAYDLYKISLPEPREKVIAELDAFVKDRIKVYWKDQGYRHDHITAVLGTNGGDSIALARRRVEALSDLLKQQVGNDLITAYKRASSIVSIEEKKDGKTYGINVDSSLLKDDAEKALYERLNASVSGVSDSVQKADYAGAMEKVAALRPYIDTFFEEVTVNANDPSLRDNRLRLLAMIRGTLNQVADFNALEN